MLNSVSEEITGWKDTSRENADSSMNDRRVGKTGSNKMFVEWNITLAHFKEHVRGLRTMVNTNVKQKVTSAKAMTKIRRLLENSRSINLWAFPQTSSNLTQKAANMESGWV